MKKSTLGRGRRAAARKEKAKDRVALLANTSPPPSPSVWGIDDVVGFYPSTGTSTSFEIMNHGENPTITIPAQPVSVTDTRLPPENRFLPQHEPRRGQAPEEVIGNSALQFVPAYEESTAEPSPPKSSPKKTFRNVRTAIEATEPTWDAIIEADDNSFKGRSRRKGKPSARDKSLDDSVDSAEEKKSSPGIFRRKSKKSGASVPAAVETDTSPPPKTPMIDHSRHSKSTIDEPVSEISGGYGHKKGPRIARLAAIFSSRAVVKGGSNGVSNTAADMLTVEKVTDSKPPSSTSKLKSKLTSTTVLASPSHSLVSSGSSGYVVWPGTQDKSGKTVLIESSYDDSSVGPTAFHRKNYEQELEDAAELEMHKWMNDENSYGESSAGSPRRRRAPKKNFRTKGGEETYHDSDFTSDRGNPADFHLAAVLADVSGSVHSSSTKRSPNVSYHGEVGSRRNGMKTPENKGRFGHSRSTPTLGSERHGGTSSVGGTSASTGISIHNLFGRDTPSTPNRVDATVPSYKGDPWDVDSSSHPPSSPGTSVSKDSSAYFQTRDGTSGMIDPSSRYGVRPDPLGIAAVMRRKHEPLPPTREALAMNNHLTPGPRTFNAMNIKGYPGFLNKTRDVPNLMDEVDSDSIASSKATSMVSAPPPNIKTDLARFPSVTGRRQQQEVDEESDVFDGISNIGESQVPLGARPKTSGRVAFPKQEAHATNDVSVVLLGGGLSAVRTTQDAFDRRTTSSEFDENLTNSEVDQYGFARTPGFNKMMSAGTTTEASAKLIHPTKDDSEGESPGPSALIRPLISTRAFPTTSRGSSRGVFDTSFGTESESDSQISSLYHSFSVGFLPAFAGDLSRYRIHPNKSKKLVRKYRKMCKLVTSDLMVDELEREEDAKKAFALSEMRSRVMEKDIERGLERQGGTIPVDDIVLTPFNQGSYRIRDAVIVSKAWRDGASPRDVVTASKMTRRAERRYCVKRPIRGSRLNRLRSMAGDASSSTGSDYWYAVPSSPRVYVLEEVQWLDDTDFMQLKCPSLGPRSMRGFEMFTIGDCQSILLKLTNERCMLLKEELNHATARQIDAEEIMREEGDTGHGMMTEAEMTYLTAMEEVKTISKQLVVAEKAFSLVKERIEKLVARYEQLLARIENESIATASVITYESSYYSDEYESDYSSEGDREREVFQRRARRAELKAELAAREAVLAKQEAEKIKEEKQREIEALQQKLAELQSESSQNFPEKEHSIILAKAITAKAPIGDGQSSHDHHPPQANQVKIDGVKQKFRDRMFDRMKVRNPQATNGSDSGASSAIVSSSRQRFQPAARTVERPPQSVRSLHRRLVGEEMFQHLDFYERSLQAVDATSRPS